MGGVEGEVLHPYRFQGGGNTALDLLRGYTKILRAEGYILLHHVGNDLVVRVLEHHAHPAADLQQEVLIGGVHAVHPDLAANRQQDRVHVLGQGGFPGAVVAQDDGEASTGNGEVHALESLHRLLALIGRIGERQIPGFYDFRHECSSLSIV